MAHTSIEISVKGKWFTVPALDAGGKAIVVRGKWIKVAAVNGEEWLETELEDPDTCVKKLREHESREMRADILTFAQKLPAVVPKYPFPVEWDSIAAVRTTSFVEWWESLPQETRKNVRRSQKRGVVVTVRELDDELIKGVVELNNDSPLRQGRPYVHYGKTFEQVKKDQSSYQDRSEFICAYFESELVGFLKMVRRGDVASILQFLPKASHNDKRPANALIAKAVEICAVKGISYLTYGLFNYGNKRANPLREFKSRHGFGEIRVPRFYVPLTGWGRMCIKLNLHRGYLGILPDAIIRLGVNARSKWYNLRHSNEPV